MLFQKQAILLLVAQSSFFLASTAFVVPSPFGFVPSTKKSAGPLFSDVVSAVSSTAEDEASESIVEETVVEEAIVEEPELPEATAVENDDEEAEEETSDDDEEEPEAQAPPRFERERLTVFVGNLPFQTTDSEVRDLFTEYGTVELVSVPRSRETGQARGFAFVDMATREDLDKAIEGVNGIMYGGRTLRAAESLPKEQLEKGEKRDFKNGTNDEGTKKIYVGNLPFETDKEELIEFYSQYGAVRDIYIPLNAETGQARGFAFVTMDEEDADNAIEETNGQTFMGRRITVSLPLPRGQKAPPRPSASDRTKLYVGNLSFYTTLDTVHNFFSEYGTVYDCYLPEDRETGGSRGFAFVTMDKEGATTAIDELDGYELDGRIIRVNEAQPREERVRRDDFYDDDGGYEEDYEEEDEY